VLLERSLQLGLLREALADVASNSRGAIVLVSGEAGIGKTALLREFCRGVGRSTRVLWSACDPLFAPRPLGPLIDLAEVTGGELAAGIGERPKPTDVAAGLLREIRSAGQIVLVIEDLHWADEATLDVVRLVAGRLDQVGVLLVATYRDDELGRSHPLRVTLGTLPAELVAHAELSALSGQAVAQLAESARVDPKLLHRRTGGNPFFVTEVLASANGRIPATVKDAVLARVARLDPSALDVLDAVAVVPGRAERWLVDALAPDDAAAHLDKCLESGILTTDGDYVLFRHEIARLVVEESLPPGRRAALHRSLLTALEEPAKGKPNLARLAHHAEGAGDGGAVLRHAPAAAEQAAAAGARREAVGEYARALRFADRVAPPQRAALLERYAGEGYYTGLGEDACVALREALAIYRQCGDLERQGAVLRQLGKQLGIGGKLLEARQVQREAVAVLEQLPPGAELARTYATVSAAYGLSDDAEAMLWGKRAIALAEETGCVDALIYALNNVGMIELRRGDLAGMARLERSRDLALQSGDEAGVGRALLHLALLLIVRRDWVQAERYLGGGITYCREHGLDAWLAWLTALQAESELAHGRWDEAAAIAESILRTESEGFSHTRCTALVILAKVRARRGDVGYWPLLDEARELVRSVTAVQSQLLVAAARAEAAWLEGAPSARIASETDHVVAADLNGVFWFAGEIACWRWRAGLPVAEVSRAAEPYRLEITGDAAAAARWWQERQCPYEEALALASSSGHAAGLRQALDVLRNLGARPAAAIVTRRLHALGERGVPRGPRSGTSANPAGLTEREAQVVALLAGGLSNMQIAAQLIVSARTVDHHVAAILRKLGVPSRAEAMIEAVRLGLATPDSGSLASDQKLPRGGMSGSRAPAGTSRPLGVFSDAHSPAGFTPR